MATNIDNLTIDELLGGVSKQEIIAYFRYPGKRTQQQDDSRSQVINNYNNTTNNNYSSSECKCTRTNAAPAANAGKQRSFVQRAETFVLSLTATDWILIVIALLLFINILLSIKYHD